MARRKPRVAVFFGGSPDNYDLSYDTGRWVSEYLPRSTYDVIPIHVTPAGAWQVPLGNLPHHGGVGRALEMLQAALPALSVRQGAARLFAREPDVLFTVLRGKGGDDGALQQLAETMEAAAVGPSPAVCLTTANKNLCAQALEPLVLAPFSITLPKSSAPMEAAAVAADTFSAPVFVKPASSEGSTGVTRIEQAAQLPAAIAALQRRGDVLVQEAKDGTEISVTVYEDESGQTRTLPPVEVHPVKAQFFDSLAKRRAGRVSVTAGDAKSSLMRRAGQLARDIYESLSAKGALTIDLIAHGNDLDLLEVNTVPVAAGQAPLLVQLAAAGTHPTQFVDSLVRAALTSR